MYPFAHDADRPEHPLSDEQTMAQVLEPAKQPYENSWSARCFRRIQRGVLQRSGRPTLPLPQSEST